MSDKVHDTTVELFSRFPARGGATGWTGVDMSMPLFLKIDFRIRLNSMKKKLGGGVVFGFSGIGTRFPSFTIQGSVVVVCFV